MWLSFFLKSKLSFQFSFFFHTNYVFLKHVFMSGNMDKIKRQEVITNREVLNPHINNTIQSNTNVCWRFPHGACLWQEWQLNKLEGKRVFLYESVDTNLLLHPSNKFFRGDLRHVHARRVSMSSSLLHVHSFQVLSLEEIFGFLNVDTALSYVQQNAVIGYRLDSRIPRH